MVTTTKFEGVVSEFLVPTFFIFANVVSCELFFLAAVVLCHEGTRHMCF